MQMPPKSTDTNLNPQTQEHFLLSFERPASSSEDNTLLTSSDKLTIVLCTRGCKTVQLNFTEYVLEPGSIAFLYPNTIWKPIKTSSDFQARYLSMREHSPKERNAFLDLETIFSLSTYIARHPHTSLSANESIVVEGYFRLIQNRYEAHVNYAIIRSLISAFILELNQMFAIRVERKKLKISRKEDLYIAQAFILGHQAIKSQDRSRDHFRRRYYGRQATPKNHDAKYPRNFGRTELCQSIFLRQIF